MNKEQFLAKFFGGFKNQSVVAELQKIPHNFVVTHDHDNKVTNMTIYGIIGESWWSDSTSDRDVADALQEAGDNDVVINMNSPGGSVFDGLAIYNLLKRHKGKVTIHVDGWACSAASVILMAADDRRIGIGAMVMAHEASTWTYGTKTDMQKDVDFLAKIDNAIVNIYMTKATISRDEIIEKVEAETWLDAQEAIEIGFADIDESESVEDVDNNATNNEGTKRDVLAIIDEANAITQSDDGVKMPSTTHIPSALKHTEPKKPQNTLLQRFANIKINE